MKNDFLEDFFIFICLGPRTPPIVYISSKRAGQAKYRPKLAIPDPFHARFRSINIPDVFHKSLIIDKNRMP